MFKAIPNENTYHLYRVKKTQVEMMHDRGYVPQDETQTDIESAFLDGSMTFSRFKRLYPTRADLSQSYILPQESGITSRAYVYYYPSENTRRNEFGQKIAELEAEQYDTIVFIQNGVLKDVSNEISKFKTITIQVFYDIELMYNVTHHSFVPRHTALTPEERAELFGGKDVGDVSVEPLGTGSSSTTKKRHPTIEPGQMPVIRFTDPVVKYYNFKPRQVIKIDRVNFLYDTAVPNTVFYRIVSSN